MSNTEKERRKERKKDYVCIYDAECDQRERERAPSAVAVPLDALELAGEESMGTPVVGSNIG